MKLIGIGVAVLPLLLGSVALAQGGDAGRVFKRSVQDAGLRVRSRDGNPRLVAHGPDTDLEASLRSLARLLEVQLPDTNMAAFKHGKYHVRWHRASISTFGTGEIAIATGSGDTSAISSFRSCALYAVSLSGGSAAAQVDTEVSGAFLTGTVAVAVGGDGDPLSPAGGAGSAAASDLGWAFGGTGFGTGKGGATLAESDGAFASTVALGGDGGMSGGDGGLATALGRPSAPIDTLGRTTSNGGAGRGTDADGGDSYASGEVAECVSTGGNAQDGGKGGSAEAVSAGAAAAQGGDSRSITAFLEGGPGGNARSQGDISSEAIGGSGGSGTLGGAGGRAEAIAAGLTALSVGGQGGEGVFGGPGGAGIAHSPGAQGRAAAFGGQGGICLLPNGGGGRGGPAWASGILQADAVGGAGGPAPVVGFSSGGAGGDVMGFSGLGVLTTTPGAGGLGAIGGTDGTVLPFVFPPPF